MRWVLRESHIQAVTAHIISQKAVVKHRGCKDCAILLGAFPLNSNYKGIEAHNEQKESAVLLFLPFGSRMAPVLYPPVEHADLINQTYLNMGLEADLRKTDVLSIPCEKFGTYAIENRFERGNQFRRDLDRPSGP